MEEFIIKEATGSCAAVLTSSSRRGQAAGQNRSLVVRLLATPNNFALGFCQTVPCSIIRSFLRFRGSPFLTNVY